ncbi:hypothetical protein BH23VER1_BH23VER1_23360 [soil metagenome]
MDALIIDWAVRGTSVLAVAGLAAFALFRASASARHLVWLVAMVALLVVPLLSVSLPQWRALPRWESPVATALPAATHPSPAPRSPGVPPETAPRGSALAPEAIPRGSGVSPEALLLASRPESPEAWPWLSLVWTAGFAIGLLRLLVAHATLARTARRSTPATDRRLIDHLAAPCRELGIGRPALLLLDKSRTVPVVWGLRRARLLLPEEALTWSDAQLRSVFLHELAHVKRRDPLGQWIAGLACALHWWNPLAWLAAWRLHVERERACDDLVLAAGVRPSDYAEHLLDVAARLTGNAWSNVAGLAMARRSSLGGRLAAVLSPKTNRRRASLAFATAVVVLGLGTAIPIAILRAADPPWSPPSASHIGNGTAFLLEDDGGIRQLAMTSPAIRDADAVDALLRRIEQHLSAGFGFLTSDSALPDPAPDFGDDATLEIKDGIARLRWPPKGFRPALGHDIALSADGKPWALGWEPGSAKIWHVGSAPDGELRFTATSWEFQPDEPEVQTQSFWFNPAQPSNLFSLPAALGERFVTFFGGADAERRPVLELNNITQRAREVMEDGTLATVRPPPANELPWDIRFIDGETGEPAPELRTSAFIGSASVIGSNNHRSRQILQSVGPGEILTLVLAGDEYAQVDGVGGNYLRNHPVRVGNYEDNRILAGNRTSRDGPATVKVWRGQPVAGRVLLPDGTPAASARVFLETELTDDIWKDRLPRSGSKNGWSQSNSTREDGTFAAAVPPATARGPLRITVRAEGAVPYESTIAEHDLENLVIRTETGVLVHGRVLGLEGEPLAGARMMTSTPSSIHYPPLLTDADGYYEFRIAPGPTVVSIAHRSGRDSLPGAAGTRTPTVAIVEPTVVIPEGVTEFERNFHTMRVAVSLRTNEPAPVIVDAPTPPITHWGPVRDRRRLGLRIDPDADWRVGGSVGVELWVHNTRTDPSLFGADAAGGATAGIAVIVEGAERDSTYRYLLGDDLLGLQTPLPVQLPPGEVRKVRSFVVGFPEPGDASERDPALQTGVRHTPRTGALHSSTPAFPLEPGAYDLRCTWRSDTAAGNGQHGELTTAPAAFIFGGGAE